MRLKKSSFPNSVLGKGWVSDTHNCVSRKHVMVRMEIRENKSVYLKTWGKKNPKHVI